MCKRPQIGVSFPRFDGKNKVTGLEKYAADYYDGDFVWAGVKRSEPAHARLLELDAEDARRLPGVLAVLTYRDITGTNRQGIVRKDQPVLVNDKVRRYGDALALILAEDRSVLKQAQSLIEVRQEPLSPVFSVEEALADGAPVIHEDNPHGNILSDLSVQRGMGAAAMESCSVRVEHSFELPRQEHAYLETECGWAHVSESGQLVIVASTQSPFRDRTEVASALGLDPSRIRVIAPYLGGAFGGKDGATVQILLALAALNSGGRPVKMWWDREESFLASVKRLSGRASYRLGADAEGAFHALECTIDLDNGPYEHLGGEVLALAVEHASGPYRIPHTHVRGRCIYTNNPAGGPFRGFGAPQVSAAMEQMVDLLAAKLHMNPLELRSRNAVRQGDRNCVGVTLTQSTGAMDCLERLSRHPLWMERAEWKKGAGSWKRRGVGIACLAHGSGYGPIVPDYANASIELTSKGAFRITCGVSDMGQGNASTYLQIGGYILNQDCDGLELILPDTERTLPSCSSAASRTTYTYANALIGAATALKQRIYEKASDLLMAGSTADFELLPGFVRHLPTGRDVPLSALAKNMAPAERVSVHHWRAPVCKEPVNAKSNTTLLGLPHILFSYAAHLAYVEVDELTGRMEVVRYLAVTDSGRVINPQVYEQQIQGGIVQGIGYGLYEDYKVENGRSGTPDLSTYLAPTALDAPDMESIPVELHEPTGPFGLKGVGEIAISGPLPAAANALADACGVRISRAPFTPERVLAALNQKEDDPF
ncbi:MAG: xanthine dehydrogenase family protein [Deltaproteobacteria bacterium]|nr:xanthine dehydrogenase family protein [Deltaproteobacteria bacterium]